MVLYIHINLMKHHINYYPKLMYYQMYLKLYFYHLYLIKNFHIFKHLKQFHLLDLIVIKELNLFNQDNYYRIMD